MNTVIIGNCGSGKSWLATEITTTEEIIHLDHIFWEPGGFDRKRSESEIQRLISDALACTSWIAEGVFDDLAERFVENADRLIWLDLPWEICRERIVNRSMVSNVHMDRRESRESITALLEWGKEYCNRDGYRSWCGHREMYEKFTGEKIILKSEKEVELWVSGK